MRFARQFAVAGTAFALCGLATVGTAAADPVVIPFQINSAPYGIPGGSFDASPARCAAVVGEQSGTVVITGAQPQGWGCSTSTPVSWINLSTGATGNAVLSNGLNGIPSAATLYTGVGQVAVMLTPGGTYTPGLATFFVP
ncbi:hypothetical protein [Nocardia seriolae]|uniref:hypothetical protein n=1 Tax=Nocardia seriolae TaxID=37332 RepID=UPI0008FF5BFE|nr:hypothetical protein [Nocardia seriolae]OJF77843.1 hypothetical protein NS14008_38200 [Nocardia seriolae]PSK26725.1 hypothetical protein C6575_35715 [Nocardia seriolae]QOW30793.1 hypothetical protein IMZ23_21755 [Nocardia seriolae]QUN15279.1 hypothetical protein KEC46_23155 [Nocardia seriolae]WNJ57716.1 hypothetical protein RMO66_30640 [Nocardia seriolae]